MTPAGQTPSLRGLLALAWPIIVSRSTQVVVGLTDALMVARLGEDALAATTTGGMNVFTILILPLGTVFIVSSFASQHAGKGELAHARRFGVYGLVVAAATQMACMVAIPFAPALLSHFDYTPGVRALMSDYIALRLWGGGAAIGIEALANYYGGIGNTRVGMVANIAAMVLNVVGNWVLIFGNLGVPAMGVRGAAIASALATAIAFVGFLAKYLSDGRATGSLWPRHLTTRELGRMLRFGLPAGFNWFFEFAAFSVFVNLAVASLGTSALAALMAVLQLNSVAFMPALGLASAGAIFVGQQIGAGNRDAVPGTVRLTMFAAAAWQSLAGLAYLFAPALLFRPFVHDPVRDAELLAVGARMLMLSSAWQLFDAAANVLSEALRGAGDTAFPLWARIAIAWGIFAPGSYVSIVYFGGGELVAVGWIVAYLGLLALVLGWRFSTGAWRRIELTESTASIG